LADNGRPERIVDDCERGSNPAALANALDPFGDYRGLEFGGDVGVNIRRIEAAGECGPKDVGCDLTNFGIVEAERGYEAVGEVEDAGAQFREFQTQVLRALKTVEPTDDGKDEYVVSLDWHLEPPDRTSFSV